MIWIIALAAFAIGFLSTSMFMQIIIARLKFRHIYLPDTNKPGGKVRKVPALGGIAVFTGLIFSICILIVLFHMFNLNIIKLDILLYGLLTVALLAFLGLVDDILIFKNRMTKPLMTLFAVIPLMAANFSNQLTMKIPFYGTIEWGPAYALIFIPLAVIFCANAVNILAGLDGLVPGMGMIATAGLFFISLMHHNTTGILYFAILLAAIYVLYHFNEYPSKVFPGNVGTLLIGGAIAVGAIIANTERALMIVMIPYGIHFLMYMRNGFKFTPHEMGVVKKDGTLKSEYKKSYGLTLFLMNNFKKMTEKKVVMYLIGFETIFAILAVVVEMYPHLFGF